MKRVRMLTDRTVDELIYRCGQVVDFPPGLAKELVNLGEADGAPGAVAFGLKENAGNVLVHETEAQRAACAGVAALEKELAELEAKFNAETEAAKRDEIGKQGAEVAERLKAAKAALAERS